MDCSMPGFLVLHYLLEFAQTHVHWVSDASQPSYPSPCHPLLHVFRSNPIYQFIPSPPSPSVSTHPFFTFSSAFLLCKQIHLYHFSRFHICVLIHQHVHFEGHGYWLVGRDVFPWLHVSMWRATSRVALLANPWLLHSSQGAKNNWD